MSQDLTLDNVSQDVFDKIVSFSKNPATLFYVNRALRQRVLAHFERTKVAFLQLEPGKTYYVIDGSLDTHDWDGNELTFCHSRLNQVRGNFSTTGFTLALFDPKQFPGDVLFVTKENMQWLTRAKLKEDFILSEVSAKFNNQYKVQVLDPMGDLREKVLYIAKTDNGIRYAVMTGVGDVVIQGSGIAPLICHQGEITFANLPLLECYKDKSFTVEVYQPLLDRMLALLATRKICIPPLNSTPLIDTVFGYTFTAPIFTTQEEAQKYAQSRVRHTKMGREFPIIHPCTVTHPVKLSCKLVEQYFTQEKVALVPRVLKSDLVLQEGSYPCNPEGGAVAVVEDPKPKSMCLVM